MRPPYPAGIELVEQGRCPDGAVSMIACMFCPYGHPLECHFPHDCYEAQCRQLLHDEEGDDPEDFGLDPDFTAEDLSEPVEDCCAICGCTEYNSCPGGCAWSEHYLNLDRLVCTRCEPLMLAFELNTAVFHIWQNGIHTEFHKQPEGRWAAAEDRVHRSAARASAEEAGLLDAHQDWGTPEHSDQAGSRT